MAKAKKKIKPSRRARKTAPKPQKLIHELVAVPITTAAPKFEVSNPSPSLMVSGKQKGMPGRHSRIKDQMAKAEDFVRHHLHLQRAECERQLRRHLGLTDDIDADDYVHSSNLFRIIDRIRKG